MQVLQREIFDNHEAQSSRNVSHNRTSARLRSVRE
jgi:hypothetical protein